MLFHISDSSNTNQFAYVAKRICYRNVDKQSKLDCKFILIEIITNPYIFEDVTDFTTARVCSNIMLGIVHYVMYVSYNPHEVSEVGSTSIFRWAVNSILHSSL